MKSKKMPREERHYSQLQKKLEDERKSQPKKLKKVNLAINGKEKATFIAEDLEEDFELALVALLKKYQDVFAWSYQDMPGLNTSLLLIS